MNKLKLFIGAHKFLAILIVIIVVSGGYWWYHSKNSQLVTTSYVTSAVTKGTLTSSVSGTGQVAAINQADINASSSGKITAVTIKQGDVVKTGQVIATIDNRTASAQLAQARASLAQAEASYQKAIHGATGSDLTSAQNTVTNAELSLKNTQTSTATTITNAKQTLIDAQINLPIVKVQQDRNVKVKFSDMYNAGLEAEPNNTLSTVTIALSGTYSANQDGQYIISFYQTEIGWYYTVNGLGSESGLIKRGFEQALGNGLYMNISTTGTLSYSTIYTINIPNKSSASYTSAYNTYQTSLESKDTAIRQAEDAITKAQVALNQAEETAKNQLATAENTLKQARQTLLEKVSPSDQTTILSAQASVKQAQASLISAQTTYSNTTITAPFAGVVAVLNAQVGDQASTATVIATITTNQKVAEISLNEVDVAKVKIGEKASMTFSAIDNLELSGKVVQVDLIGTVTQNIVNFKIKILFDVEDERIKPGMSASAAIITDIKQDILIVPSSAVKENNSQSYVEVLVDNQPQQRIITTGISNDTDIEVLGDIVEGDKVITQTITNSTTTSTSTESRSIFQTLGGAQRTGGGNFGAVGR